MYNTHFIPTYQDMARTSTILDNEKDIQVAENFTSNSQKEQTHFVISMNSYFITSLVYIQTLVTHNVVK